jgi:hypothetical protein
MDDVRARAHLQQLEGEVVHAAGARRAVVELSRLLPRQREESLHAVGGETRVDDEHERADGDRRDRDKLPQRIVTGIARGRGDGGKRRGDEQQGVSVGLGLRDLGRSDGSAGTRAVVDHDGRRHRLAQLLRHQRATASVPAPGGNSTTRRIDAQGRPGSRPAPWQAAQQHRDEEAKPRRSVIRRAVRTSTLSMRRVDPSIAAPSTISRFG